mmetsp:Transcript_10363/g.33469  ORF Transcript_10363/g.33469 Transcript_10363/m.33469 type:complete len:310 (+) Transcript_10363:1986-2915(+)
MALSYEVHAILLYAAVDAIWHGAGGIGGVWPAHALSVVGAKSRADRGRPPGQTFLVYKVARDRVWHRAVCSFPPLHAIARSQLVVAGPFAGASIRAPRAPRGLLSLHHGLHRTLRLEALKGALVPLGPQPECAGLVHPLMMPPDLALDGGGRVVAAATLGRVRPGHDPLPSGEDLVEGEASGDGGLPSDFGGPPARAHAGDRDVARGPARSVAPRARRQSLPPRVRARPLEGLEAEDGVATAPGRGPSGVPGPGGVPHEGGAHEEQAKPEEHRPAPHRGAGALGPAPVVQRVHSRGGGSGAPLSAHGGR